MNIEEKAEYIKEKLKGFYPTSSRVTPAIVEEIARKVTNTREFDLLLDDYREKDKDGEKCPAWKSLKKYQLKRSGGDRLLSDGILVKYLFHDVCNFGWTEAMNRIIGVDNVGTGNDIQIEAKLKDYVYRCNIHTMPPYECFPDYLHEFFQLLHIDRKPIKAIQYLCNSSFISIEDKRIYEKILNSIQRYTLEDQENYFRFTYWFYRYTGNGVVNIDVPEQYEDLPI